MNLSETFEAMKKLPPEVTDSVMPHIGGLSFFAGILSENMDMDLSEISKKEMLKIAFDYTKKKMKNSGMSTGEKAKFLVGLPKLAKDSENHMRILKTAVSLIENPENTFPLNEEWAACFFEYSKKISDRDIQMILGRILAEELENKDGETVELSELSDEYFDSTIEKMKIS